MRWVLPENKKQWKWFAFGVSSSAGICEELLFRGYLIWLLEPVVGMPLAVVLSSVLFGLNHFYQGFSGMIKTALVGLLLAIVYWVTGSLWFAIGLHILIDVYAGTQSWFAFRDELTQNPSTSI
jgi:membrane protease YdiL (CAAX protease family)